MKRKKASSQESSSGTAKSSNRRTRRKIDDSLKTKIVLESLKETEPLSVLASRYGVHPNQIGQWRKLFLSNAHTVFSGKKDSEQEIEQLSEERNEYARKVGELTMDVEFLKKNLRKLGML